MQIIPSTVSRTPPRAFRVLLVEDHALLREGIKAALRSGEHRYEIAGEVDDGLAVYSACILLRPDIVLLDLGLPGMNGRQLAEIGRQYRPDLKVLFITGYAEHAAVRGGFLDPGMQMITKPFTFDLLTAKVREMIKS